jgi:hypothetical protein
MRQRDTFFPGGEGQDEGEQQTNRPPHPFHLPH